MRVQHYRSIVDIGEIALGDITLFVGANNAGKSSMLGALYSFQQGGPSLFEQKRINDAAFPEVALSIVELAATSLRHSTVVRAWPLRG